MATALASHNPSRLPIAERAAALWGCGDPTFLFKGADRVVLPWRLAPQRKTERLASNAELSALLTGGPHLVDLDPRAVFATQTWVVRSHVEHYLNGTWERTGRTAADRHRSANRYPLVKVNERGDLVLLGGHHRAAAALIQGRTLRARVTPPAGSHSVAVLPSLLAGGTTGLDHTLTGDAAVAAQAVAAGSTVVVADLDVARQALLAIGLDSETINDRLAMAATGRCLGNL